MRFPIRRRRLLVTGAVSAIGLALAAGIAYATIPDSAGVIHGCYQKVDGQLRVIDQQAGASCRPSEQQLDWNQTGAPGPPGPTGPQGPKGDPGAAPSFSTYTVVGDDANVGPKAELDESVNCNPGDLATGGGYILNSTLLQVRISSPDPHGWEVDVVNPSANSWSAFQTIVDCLRVS